MGSKEVQTGVALGSLFGKMHASWIVAASLNFGQPILSILESGHFISLKYSITALDRVKAFLGVIGAAFTGYIIG